MRSIGMGFASLLLGAGIALAEPATITAEAPEVMVEVLQSLGYRAELTKDGEGDPLIRSAASGLKFGIYFYGCDAGSRCTTVQFYLGLELGRTVALSELNDWNRNKRFGVAVLDTDGEPYLKLDLNLDYGGITTPAFEDNLELWERLMADFAEHLQFNEPLSPQEKAAPPAGPLKDL